MTLPPARRSANPCHALQPLPTVVLEDPEGLHQAGVWWEEAAGGAGASGAGGGGGGQEGALRPAGRPPGAPLVAFTPYSDRRASKHRAPLSTRCQHFPCTCLCFLLMPQYACPLCTSLWPCSKTSACDDANSLLCYPRRIRAGARSAALQAPRLHLPGLRRACSRHVCRAAAHFLHVAFRPIGVPSV